MAFAVIQFLCKTMDEFLQLCRNARKLILGFLTRCDTNQPVKSQRQARDLKYLLEVEQELYYPYSENKGADQLCSYCEAVFASMFSHMQKSSCLIISSINCMDKENDCNFI